MSPITAKRLSIWLTALVACMPLMGHTQTVINTNNAPVSSTNPLYILTSSQKNPAGVPYIDDTGTSTSYAVGLSFAGTTGVLMALCGSATKIVAVRGLSMTGTASTVGSLNLSVIKTSTAPTAGTTVVPVPSDSTDPAATAMGWYYTTAPTPGTAVGTVFTWTQFFPTASGGQGESQVPREIRPYPQHAPLILRGTNQCMELYTTSTALSGPSLQVTVGWTEEASFP